jgi:hypothetical protein
LTVVPVTLILVSLTAGSRDASGDRRAAPGRQEVIAEVVSAVKQPLIWLPVLGIAEEETASALLLSLLTSVVTIGAFIALTGA